MIVSKRWVMAAGETAAAGDEIFIEALSNAYRRMKNGSALSMLMLTPSRLRDAARAVEPGTSMMSFGIRATSSVLRFRMSSML
jgi:hypothetical protein